jgi:spermidine synthase
MTNDKKLEWKFTPNLEDDLLWTPDLWFSERFQGMVSFGLRVKEALHTEQSPFQHIAVYDTYKHGRLLTLDGIVMLTELDEFIYHEMIVHVPMQTLPQARRAVVIGGGDGGTVRELVKYPELEEITLVEIDARVVAVCREHLPSVAAGFDDARVVCRFEDGAKFIKEAAEGSIDLLIVDSTDPLGPGKVLFSPAFYRDCARALSPQGVLTAQTETPVYHASVIRDIYTSLGQAFTNAFMYWYAFPSFIGSIYTFAYASMTRHPLRDHQPRGLERLALRYYHQHLHHAAFVLPQLAAYALPKGHPQSKGYL